MSIAFFDFDGTLIRQEAGVICAIPSIRSGLVRPALGARLIATYLLSKVGLRTRTAAQRIGFECYAGRTLPELRGIMQALYDEHLRSELSEPMRARVAEHGRRGDRRVILTASAFFVAEPIRGDFQVEDLVGTQVEFAAGGACTGRVEGPILDGPEKLSAARAYAAAHGVDLSCCTFYTDHVADLPLLEAVGTPVVVGSRRALTRVARARGWPIVRHDDLQAKLGP